MTDASVKGLKPRTLEIFQEVVAAYLEDGLPVGSSRLAKTSKIDLSSASIRSKMSDLEDAGLLYAPHTSAGRVPTETGLRLFVDGLMEFSRDLKSDERSTIDSECAVRGISLNQLLDNASKTLSGLSNCASLVLSLKSEADLQHFEFVSIGGNRALAVLVRTDGQVENRLIDLPVGMPPSSLTKAANYMNAKLANRGLKETAALIREDITLHRAELDELTTGLVEQGIGIWSDGEGGVDAALIMRGQANLLDDIQAMDELVEIRELFDALDARENALRLLNATRDGDGVKIFIGAENKLFASTGCSMVIAPYRNADRLVIGAVGVIGPRHMNYARIIPMVDYTSKAIARVLGR
jgi:heat-inducible transcriptional repressor